jgi:hypothetical protein
MSSFRLRPRFKHRISGNQESLEHLIKEALEDHESFTSQHLPGHLVLKLRAGKRHNWSPQLQLSFEQDGEHIIIRGLYGPNPTLWAIFFFGYLSLSILSLFVMVWGFSVWSLGKPATILYALPVFLVMAFLLYVGAQAGQKLGAQQMFDLHHFYEEITKSSVAIN